MTRSPGEDARHAPAAFSLTDLLDLEDLGGDAFRSRRTEPNLSGALFGGQVLAQSLRAALFTVEERPVHSLHGYFIRPGSETKPVVYQVERTRDGANFTTRRVTAQQGEKTIFHMEASFHGGAPGVTHADAPPQVPGPDAVSLEDPFARSVLEDGLAELAFPGGLLPLVERRLAANGGPDRAARDVWMRIRDEALATPALRACGLAYLSDFWLGGVGKIVHPEAIGQRLTSLDHAMWFHEPTDPTQWLLHSMRSPWAGSSRSLAQGAFHDLGGRLIATVAQEIYLFPNAPHGAPRVGEIRPV